MVKKTKAMQLISYWPPGFRPTEKKFMMVPKTAFNTSKRGFLCPLILYGWRASSCDPNILIFSLVTRHIDVLHKYLEKYVNM